MHGAAPKAVVLLSGGLDSATVLAIAQDQGYALYALSFRYSQRHRHELQAAQNLAQARGVVEHRIIDIDPGVFAGSALTGGAAVPKGRSADDMGHGIPVTYVPARNTLFLSYALAWAEVLQARDLFIGVNAVDYSGYPDCRPEFIHAYEVMANLATKAAVQDGHPLRIHTPLLHLSKAQIIQRGLTLGVDYAATHSCYDPAPSGTPCGACDACLLRRRGFADLGLQDPLPYPV